MNETTFRPISEEDMPFLQRLYGSTRESELNRTAWSPEEKRAFIEMQFNAQHRHYQEHFGNARFDLVLNNDGPVGRLYVDRRPDEIRIIDIALLPEFCGRGIGTSLMQRLIDEAAETRLPVRIHVEQFNPALRLYEWLGFHRIRDEGVYYLMERKPGG
jgi:GNAT superfamily N-acetyltransferase